MEKVLINKLDYEGNGICLIEGKITFVDGALPGEELEIEITESKKNYNKAIIKNIIKASNSRINNNCPYKNCGGCDFLHTSYKDELVLKENVIKDLFLKKCNFNHIDNIIPSNSESNYRNKITLKVLNNKIGLYEKKSHVLVPIKKCLLVNDKMNVIINELNNINLNGIDEIIIKNGIDTFLMFKSTKKININIKNLNVDNVILNYNDNFEVLKGNNYYNEIFGDIKYQISNDSFFQINKKSSINLYDEIIKLADFSKSDTVLDLYSGIGSISLYISKYVKKVIGVEINKNAIDSANINKKINNVNNVEFICTNVNKIKDININPNIIIVDPPRSGLDKKTIDHIKELKAKKIIYVSCNPLTLVQNINELKNTYELKNISLIDMFPRTHHVECVCVLCIKETRKALKNKKEFNILSNLLNLVDRYTLSYQVHIIKPYQAIFKDSYKIMRILKLL